MITLGGDAELELVDTLDPFSEVCVDVNPKPSQTRPLQLWGFGVLELPACQFAV